MKRPTPISVDTVVRQFRAGAGLTALSRRHRTSLERIRAALDGAIGRQAVAECLSARRSEMGKLMWRRFAAAMGSQTKKARRSERLERERAERETVRAARERLAAQSQQQRLDELLGRRPLARMCRECGADAADGAERCEHCGSTAFETVRLSVTGAPATVSVGEAQGDD